MWDDVAPCGTCSTHCQPTANQVTFSPRAWLHLRLVFPPCPAGHCRALRMESRENFSQSPHKQRCLACFRRTISFTLPYLQKRLLPIHVLFLERDSSRLEMPLVSKCRIMQLPRAKRVWHENYETLLQIANNVPTCSNMFQHVPTCSKTQTFSDSSPVPSSAPTNQWLLSLDFCAPSPAWPRLASAGCATRAISALVALILRVLQDACPLLEVEKNQMCTARTARNKARAWHNLSPWPAHGLKSDRAWHFGKGGTKCLIHFNSEI